MQQTLDIVIERAEEQGATAVCSITMQIGDLSGVVPDAMEFAFEALTLGTIIEGGRLIIERVPVACRCRSCDEEFEPVSLFYECPRCGAPSDCVLRGRELSVISMEIPGE